MFSEKLQLSRERLEFYYSIGLLILIPAVIVANTILMVTAVRDDFSSELRRKAALANSLIAEAVKPDLANNSALQTHVDNLLQANSELAGISIAQPAGAGGQQFTTLASSDKSAVGSTRSDLQLYAAVSNDRPVAQDITKPDGERLWRVVSPLSVDGAVQAVVMTDVSSKQADGVIGATLLRSLGIVCISVILIVLLLLNHFKFVQYAMLFRKLKEVDQLKNDFLSVATHELRAPMTVIKGNIENLVDGITGKVDDRGKETLNTISAETDRLNNLVTDLLNVSRLEQGRISYNLETFDARDVVGQLAKQFTPKAEAKGMTVTYTAPDAPTYVNIDHGRLVEIMTNLIDNSIKYSRQGTVTVSHKDDKDWVRISVRDTGIGIAAKDRERLFSRFYRVQTDKTQSIPGTGLGLWIIKQYVEAMKGTISVDSLENVGTEFVVSFPRATAPSAAAPAKPTAPKS
jgi:K+-sensing histidine kinase KdpD